MSTFKKQKQFNILILISARAFGFYFMNFLLRAKKNEPFNGGVVKTADLFTSNPIGAIEVNDYQVYRHSAYSMIYIG